jgi:hypothetical protein
MIAVYDPQCTAWLPHHRYACTGLACSHMHSMSKGAGSNAYQQASGVCNVLLCPPGCTCVQVRWQAVRLLQPCSPGSLCGRAKAHPGCRSPGSTQCPTTVPHAGPWARGSPRHSCSCLRPPKLFSCARSSSLWPWVCCVSDQQQQQRREPSGSFSSKVRVCWWLQGQQCGAPWSQQERQQQQQCEGHMAHAAPAGPAGAV